MTIKTISPAPLSQTGDDIYAVDVRGVEDTISATELAESNNFELDIDLTVDYAVKRNESALVFTANAGTDVITSAAHGLLDGETTYVKGASLPGGLSQKVVYFVREKTNDTLKLALTAGDVAINLTTAGSGAMYLVSPKFRSASDTVVGTLYAELDVGLNAEAEASLIAAIEASQVGLDAEKLRQFFTNKRTPIGGAATGYTRFRVFEDDGVTTSFDLDWKNSDGTIEPV